MGNISDWNLFCKRLESFPVVLTIWRVESYTITWVVALRFCLANKLLNKLSKTIGRRGLWLLLNPS